MVAWSYGDDKLISGGHTEMISCGGMVIQRHTEMISCGGMVIRR